MRLSTSQWQNSRNGGIFPLWALQRKLLFILRCENGRRPARNRRDFPSRIPNTSICFSDKQGHAPLLFLHKQLGFWSAKHSFFSRVNFSQLPGFFPGKTFFEQKSRVKHLRFSPDGFWIRSVCVYLFVSALLFVIFYYTKYNCRVLNCKIFACGALYEVGYWS